MLLHNPKAGDENHVPEELVTLIEDFGYSCKYHSIREEAWKQEIGKVDLIAVAGGDGSVRTIAKEMVVQEKAFKKIPLAILPMGTANNLFKSLGIWKRLSPVEEIVRKWDLFRIKNLDVGVVIMDDLTDFFIEGFGFGAFPKLIELMHQLEDNIVGKKDNEVRFALQKMIDVVKEYPLERFEIQTENRIIEIECFLLEVMNIKSIGPNLCLAPNLPVGGGCFDIVYITQAERKRFMVYLQSLIEGRPFNYRFHTIRSASFTLKTSSRFMHLDDELKENSFSEISFSSKKSYLEFLA